MINDRETVVDVITRARHYQNCETSLRNTALTMDIKRLIFQNSKVRGDVA